MLRRFAGFLFALFPDEVPKKRVPFTCHIGWHDPKLRQDLAGYYLGCGRCDWADTFPTRGRKR